MLRYFGLSLKILNLLSLLLKLFLLQFEVVQVPLYLIQIRIILCSLMLVCELLLILLLHDFLFKFLLLQLGQMRLLVGQRLGFGLLPDLVLLGRLAGFKLVLARLVAHALAAYEAGSALVSGAACCLPWSVAFSVAEAGAARAEACTAVQAAEAVEEVLAFFTLQGKLSTRECCLRVLALFQ